MTDTGQVPGEGLPESAGTAEQPGVPAAHGAYPYLSETTAEDEDLLMPGTQGAWGNEVPPPAPEPLVEAVHEPGPHEISGRDSGSVDLSDVRLPGPSAPTAPTTPIPPITPRRPLHLGPPIPDASASPVRSLADRGAVGAPVPQPATPWPSAPVPVGSEAQAAETVVPAEQPMAAAQVVASRAATEASAVPAPQEASYGGQEPSAVDAGGVGGGVPEPGAVPGADGGAGAPAGVAAPGAEQVAGEMPVSEGGASAGPVPGGEGGQDAGPAAAAGEVPAGGQGAEGGQVPAGVEAAEAVAPVAEPARVAEVPVAEPAQAAEVPAAEEAQVAEAPTADAGQVLEDAVPEAVQIVDGAAPEGEPLPEAPASKAAQEPGTPAPDAVQVPEAAAPEVVAQTQAQAQAPESVAPQAAPAPEVAQAPEAAQPHADPTPVHAQVTPETAPEAAPTPDAPQPTDAEQPVPAPQPDAAATAPADAATAVAAEEPPQPTGTAPATQPQVVEPSASIEQPGPDPQQAQAPEAVPDPNLAQAPQPTPVNAPTDGDAEAPLADPAAQPPYAVAVSAEAQPVAAAAAAASDVADPQPVPAAAGPAEAPVAQAPDAAAAPAEAQPVAAAAAAASDDADPQPAPAETTPAEAVPADTPEPFVAEPAGPQLRAQAPPQPAQVAEDPAQPPVEPTQAGEGEATVVLPTGVLPEPDASLGQFVQVEGSVPTTPHLAPTPARPTVLPVEEGPGPVPTVPAPREGDPEVVQQADDLDTRAADQEDQAEESAAVAEEARQSTGPAAPGYDDAEREAVLKVMRERRDIRNGFRSDPIPHEVLLRVLEAAHTAPSVGHSQPWDFVVIRSSDTRRTMHELAMRQREAYAKSLPKGRAKQFKELKIEAILDTPVNIVVTADPTRGGRHTLGRHTQPQMAPYSAALAVENLWLAARAEGLGVGWVSFFDEREMVRALGLPEHLEVIAYLCVGYVDEFPEEPELMQAGWSKRRPLSWVVHEETYGRRALPGEEPHDLLAETVAQIRPLDAKALGEAWERQKRMTKPAGALGMLEIISAQLSGLSRQCPPPIPEPAAVAIFAGDHGVHAQGVTPWPQEVTAQMVANFLGGGAVCNAFAGQVGAEVCVVDVGVAADLPATPGLLPRKVRAGTSDMTTGPAMTREEAKQAIEVGIETARDLVAAGNKALLTGEMGIANTTASAALISVFTGADPAEVTGRGTGINDETLARKTEIVRRAIELHQPDPADPIGVLAAIGGFEHAALVGLLLGGASLRTPVILDGVSAGAAALVARAIAPEVLAACIAGHRSAEPGHVAALNKLGLRPLVDLDLRLGEGTGALLALPLVQSTARAMHEVATFDSAGVTEK
ncbi:nicotinate-nucleotide--dimethylbenzimidazole phosphoribosyltransferase [Streptomyces ferrugineus]|uniref:Nicotinate-nucleotide--dimethylbenzimidazole phosphoribosyltransferase n=1 Tax=Streptomyces ferrugineus TaxID=1413221 RepID=A0A7M2SVK3_9ACTN|nr:nicotinate-nucleotide--dimethylbenzimidazole phosphoribosyltransferase [Streptomyces ferrugineus]QOV39553.1 nicotinate-nucleotide--dimethylbenzimidazole phosphoribosyltransferase [Streptomyces ferrugineus]